METLLPPPPATNLSTHLYYQLVYTLTDLLPPPLDGSPEALNTRNHAAIAKVAAMLLRPISPPSASPLGPRPRTYCGCSVKTRMTSRW